ncbi:hypothetical protein [Nocardia sp. NPDC004860]|uniref:hypothetical protein n=1 Tax=Nocardia sp. NPDC004860 TaxID=3154557 RepID=UPI0033B8CDCB
MGRPMVFGLLGMALLVAAALPIAGIRYGIDMGLNSLGDRPTGQATRLVQNDFGPGLLFPIQIVAAGPGDTALSADGRTDRWNWWLPTPRRQRNIASSATTMDSTTSR